MQRVGRDKEEHTWGIPPSHFLLTMQTGSENSGGRGRQKTPLKCFLPLPPHSPLASSAEAEEEGGKESTWATPLSPH